MTDTQTDTDVLAGLDFKPACEHSQHDVWHAGNEPARYIVRARCDACTDTTTYLLCHPGWQRLNDLPAIRCPDCGHTSRDTVNVTILETLP